MLRFVPFALVLLAVPAMAQEKARKPTVDFQKQIWPILEKNCIECHATAHTDANGRLKKPKGGVTLDHKEGITTSKKGKLIVANKSADSLLYQSISLPADDEDRMPPPKKGAPLPAAQQQLIKTWIDEGADFGKWTGKAAAGDGEQKDDKGGKEKPADKGTPPKPKGGDPLVRLQQGLKPLPPALLATFADGPFRVQSVGDGSPLLRVGCQGRTDEVDDRAVAALAPLAQHIAELDLARSRIGDGACQVLATMPRLVHVDLRQTEVGNHGVAALAACKELRVLNLFGTKTGDYGVAALAGLAQLEQLYLWQTEVSAGAVVRLRERVPGVRVVVAAELPAAMADGAGRRRGR